MEATDVYLVAIVYDRSTEDRPPYVATPLGPYAFDETDALQRGADWLKDVYHTEDVRVLTPGFRCDVDWARTVALQRVHKEYQARRNMAERAVNIRVIVNVDPVLVSLDEVLIALGVEDV